MLVPHNTVHLSGPGQGLWRWVREGAVLGVPLNRKTGFLRWLWGVGAHRAADHALKALLGPRPPGSYLSPRPHVRLSGALGRQLPVGTGTLGWAAHVLPLPDLQLTSLSPPVLAHPHHHVPCGSSEGGLR